MGFGVYEGQTGNPVARAGLRPEVKGKFLFLGGEKFYIRGVTYGTFRPDDDGVQFPDAATVREDFKRMSANGMNAVRTYTVPPRWLLDLAAESSLYVMVGLPWEQHIAFLDGRDRPAEIERRVREGVRACAGHPAVLCYAIGNEIPASIVRWHGARRVEAFLKRLYRAAKQEDPGALVTYVNFPTTEYLRLPFVDFYCFNVYLETEERLSSYLSRLQNLAGDRPLVMAEIGLDSRRNGEQAQAEVLAWQIRTCFASGCAGLFLFAWTDEWHRGGYDIEDWDFGLTRRDRTPKPALAAVSQAFAESPFAPDIPWPEISVVVCTYNGSRTIAETLEHLTRLDYPCYEVIVVNDGSTDDTAEKIAPFDVRQIHTVNRGLSAARNTGLQAAKGEIVAYIDDDAYPDPHWLRYLALAFVRSKHAAIGGPNIPPPGDGSRADCVANAPGGPVHVLLTDELAEHIPGCNMAFRADILREIGGFDVQFRTAGDDVDICWRLHQNGHTIGFSPAAVVWHHRRNSLGTYWKQQVGYGKAETMLARKWPEKYLSGGTLNWSGRLYGKGLTAGRWLEASRIYHGVWGSALFQSIYDRPPGVLASLPSIPQWYLLNAVLLLTSVLGLFWAPLLVAFPLLLVSAALPVPYVIASVRRASFTTVPRSWFHRAALYTVTTGLYFAQPLARLDGKLRACFKFWRESKEGIRLPRVIRFEHWSENWRPADSWLRDIESSLNLRNALVARGGDFDNWDLEVHGGLFGHARMRLAVEEHGGGRQLIRVKLWPKLDATILSAAGLMAVIAVLAGLSGSAVVCGTAAGAAFFLSGLTFRSWTESYHSLRRALEPTVSGRDKDSEPASRIPPREAQAPMAGAAVEFRANRGDEHRGVAAGQSV
jgi:GT2 family glycosyltransferase